MRVNNELQMRLAKAWRAGAIPIALLCAFCLASSLGRSQTISKAGSAQYVPKARLMYRLVVPAMLPGATGSNVLSSSGGTMVGHCNSDMAQGGYPLAVMWKGPGKIVYIAGAGFSVSQATDVNSHGTVVGFADFFAGLGSEFGIPFVWNAGTAEVLPPIDPSGIEFRFPRAVNEAGEIVGESASHAVLWTGSVANDLGTLGGPTSSAADIADDGRIVGTADRADGTNAAALWIPLGSDSAGRPVYSVIDLGTLGGFSTIATGINASGQIVGNGALPAPLGAQGAFVHEQGVMHPLPGLGDRTLARAIDPSGTIVGTSGSAAVLWTARNRTLIDLNAVTAGLEEWTLVDANDIDASGRIVGLAEDALGNDFGVVLQPVF